MNKLTNKQTITLRHKVADCQKLYEFISVYNKSNNVPNETQQDLRLVIEEIFCNIVNHAEVTSQSEVINIEYSHQHHVITITFTDTGKKFNPLCDHKNGMYNNDHSEGGMGVHLILIKSLTDHQEYQRIKQQNVFTVTKHYNH